MEKGYKKLIVWQKADELAYMVYLATKNFPKDEIYGITSQLRRSVLSVPTNIAEGMRRQGKNETKQFINIALGSLAETEYLLLRKNRGRKPVDESFTRPLRTVIPAKAGILDARLRGHDVNFNNRRQSQL